MPFIIVVITIPSSYAGLKNTEPVIKLTGYQHCLASQSLAESLDQAQGGEKRGRGRKRAIMSVDKGKTGKEKKGKRSIILGDIQEQVILWY